MRRLSCSAALFALSISASALLGCSRTTSASAVRTPGDNDSVSRVVRARWGQLHRQVRANGTIQAVKSVTVQVPRIEGQGGDLTLIHIVKNGTTVQPGDLLVEFDRNDQLLKARDAKAQYEDLAHQVDQKSAQNRSEAEQRNAELQQAAADFRKAELEVRKGPILSDIDRQKNELKLADAKAHIESQRRLNLLKDTSAAADLRILELKRDRQKLDMERALRNSDKLLVRAPIAGMVALQNLWKNGSFGHAQEGDRLWGGPLLRIFTPGEVRVETDISEADMALLEPNTSAQIHLDAYPDVVFSAHLDTVSPVATAPPESSVKSFTANFLLDRSDPRLLPDLSAAVDIALPAGSRGILLPKGAVYFRDGRAYVNVLQPDGRASEREVHIAGLDSEFVQVASGIEAGQTVEQQPAQGKQ